MSKCVYHYCNYCKHFEPSPSSSGYGTCKYTGKDKDLTGVTYFYDWGCTFGFEHTIHNHYGLPTPDYAKEYKKAVKVRIELVWDVYEQNHKPGPIPRLKSLHNYPAKITNT